MTNFVVPVIVFRDLSVGELFYGSESRFKSTSGESRGAIPTIGAVTFVLAIPGAALGVLTFVAIPKGPCSGWLVTEAARGQRGPGYHQWRAVPGAVLA